jgi:predicted peptidase
MINNYKSTIVILLLSLILASGNILGQTEIQMEIKKALAIKPNDITNRSVNQKNIFEHFLITNNFDTPSVGSKLYEEDTGNYVWERIKPNDNGWYEDSLLIGGYAYLEVNSDEEKIVLLEGSAYSMVYVNNEPRAGNVYQYKDDWQPWEPDFGFSYLPIKLKKGKNGFLFKCNYGNFKVRFFESENIAQFNIKDLTLPDLLVNENVDHFGGIIIINNSYEALTNLAIKTEGKNFETVISNVPIIQPLSTRKVKFDFRGYGFTEKSEAIIEVSLFDKVTNEDIDQENISMRVLNNNETYKQTFVSSIDGSVQYYAVNPSTGDGDPKALFFSLHGAAVMAENQANSYLSKNWGIIVSPTNRRPYGFNWEDWGRLDVLEVFDIALNKFNIDPSRIYLTGHSMGGHGTWHIGGTYPDKFAAIGPSAGWISFWSYRFNDKYSEDNSVVNLINRTGNQSNTYELVENYNQHGIYILHGADDNNVRADQSHSIIKHLEKSHKDFIYHEEKDAGHWWDKSDETGADCVDWAPLFDYFAKHSRPEKNRILNVKFKTANPGISAKNNWVTIYGQNEFLKFSSVDLLLDPGIQRISGTTDNIEVLAIDTDVLDKSKLLKIEINDHVIDSIIIDKSDDKIWLTNRGKNWKVCSKPNSKEKGPHRYGTFKDAFKNKVVFVYGTNGTEEENSWAFSKSRYDAEYFWYQGNGAIEIVSDKEFISSNYKNRNVILFGNSETNSAWDELLDNSPIQVNRKSVKIGDKELKGNDLSCLFIRPKQGTDNLSIGVVSGTGLIGMKLNNTIPYMSPGFSYPDVTVFSSELLLEDTKGYKATGFFGYDWSVDKGEFVFNE